MRQEDKELLSNLKLLNNSVKPDFVRLTLAALTAKDVG